MSEPFGSQAMDVGYYRDMVTEYFQGKKVILATGPVAGAKNRAEEMREFGVVDCLVVGNGLGTGEVPDPAEIAWVLAHDRKAPDMLTGLRNYEAALQQPCPEVVAAVERFDPQGEAIVLGSHVSDITGLCGRRRLGPRLPRWLALEDKVVIDAFWDRAGIARAPSEVVALHDEDACQAAFAGLDAGAGVVWAGDAKEGVNGGAALVRHLQSRADQQAALEFFRAHCDRVRVMPFLQGIPCSIHGVVFPEETISFRPVEMVVFRRPAASTFLYCGFATWWDPPTDEREAMRRLAKDVGRQLRNEVGYRGAFTVDGVMTEQGFVPTELNARSGGAFGWLTRGRPELPLDYLEQMVRDGLDLDYRPEELEALVLQIADEHRVGGGWTLVDRVFEKTSKYALRRRESEHGRLSYDLVGDGDEVAENESDALLLTGPGPTGGFVRVLPHAHRRQPGASVASDVAAVWELVDRKFGTEIGAVIAP